MEARESAAAEKALALVIEGLGTKLTEFYELVREAFWRSQAVAGLRALGLDPPRGSDSL